MQPVDKSAHRINNKALGPNKDGSGHTPHFYNLLDNASTDTLNHPGFTGEALMQ